MRPKTQLVVAVTFVVTIVMACYWYIYGRTVSITPPQCVMPWLVANLDPTNDGRAPFVNPAVNLIQQRFATMSALKAYFKERPLDAGDALFVSGKGGGLSATQFYRIFRDIAKATGLPASKQHPHVLKHSIASHLVRQNVNLAKVQRFLGHAVIGSTMRYVSVSDQEATKDAHSALMNLF